jgi:hypothetical protein
MSEDKVRTKDLCWSVETIYDLRELLGVKYRRSRDWMGCYSGRAWGVGAPGARGQGRAGLGWVGLGRDGSPLHARPLTGLQLRTKSEARRDERAIKHNIRQKKYASA